MSSPHHDEVERQRRERIAGARGRVKHPDETLPEYEARILREEHEPRPPAGAVEQRVARAREERRRERQA